VGYTGDSQPDAWNKGGSMTVTPVSRIIGLCRTLDEMARDMYMVFSEKSGVEVFRDFWRHMSMEESEHVEFWKMAQELDTLPDNIFSDTDTIIHELEHAIQRTNELMAKYGDSSNVADFFTLTYRMEFYLLHPAFATLFELVAPISGVENPENSYESHINCFVEMLANYGNLTPELELLSETIQRLWRDNRSLALQATRDDLTGLFNRRGFFATAGHLTCLAHRNRSYVGVLMIDLDYFKSVNDRIGHCGGDRVLQYVSGIIQGALRSSDLLGRYGGEEFIVLLPSTGRAMTALPGGGHHRGAETYSQHRFCRRVDRSGFSERYAKSHSTSRLGSL
jgi:GGDEF domain-containing protein